MALTQRRRLVANRSPKRRKFSRAQIAAGFGGKRRQAAAKHRRRAANKSSPKRNRRANTRHRRRKSNPGEILSVVLNPGSTRHKKGKSMAAPKKRRKARRHNASTHRRRRKHNATTHRRRHAAAPAHHRRRRQNPSRRRHHRKNAGRSSGSPFGSVMHIGVSIASAFGAKYLTQAVLGASNTGFVGYIGNGLATAAIAMVAKMFGYARYVNAIVAGGALQIAIRVASDYTPYGAQLSRTGLGDYQVSNWVTPQRYVDPLNSARVEIPNGWAPTIAAPASGMSGLADYDSLYGTTSGGLYA